MGRSIIKYISHTFLQPNLTPKKVKPNERNKVFEAEYRNRVFYSQMQ